MTVIAARRYEQGKPSVHAIPLDGGPRVSLPDGCFEWVGLADPEASEMELVRARYGLHPLAVEDALNPRQLPKVDIYGSQLFIVARTASMEEGENIDFGQTAVFLGSDFVVSVRIGCSRHFADLRQRLEADAERLSEGPDFVAHAILDYVVDGYFPIMDRLEEAVQKMEENAIEAFPQPSTIRRIFRLRRRLRRFERIIGPMEQACEKLATIDLPSVDPSARVWFRDVLDHVRHTLLRLNGLKETLASIVETASLLEQHRQGDMTRQLAAWAAILAVPTAIAGVYGMNFENIPELKWHYGYYGAVGLMATVCTGLWVRFKRMRWL